MRIDKYLWCIRYHKTRSIATDAVKKGAVKINGAVVKPSREVFPGDKIELRKNQINYVIEVLDIPESRVGAKLVGLYCVDRTPQEEFEVNEMLKYAKSYYRKKGVGRPTKKDRRDLDDFLEDDFDDNWDES